MATATAREKNALGNRRFALSHRSRLAMVYMAGLLIPYLISRSLNMDGKGTYVATVSLINLLAMMAFFVQFPLAGRLRRWPLFASIDWNISRHKKTGQWLGVIFLLHPALILAPRFLFSFDEAMISIISTITSPKMLTGIAAWCLMIVWILASVFKNRLPLRYETWRYTHILGFVIIAVLSTLHVTSIGSHGQFQPYYNLLWWLLCCTSVLMVIYNYFLKPRLLKTRPFTLTQVKKISSSDWSVTVNDPSGSFDFEAGQFVWLNSSGRAGGVSDHPFSIASCRSELPDVSFVIRELGDYTSSLGSLKCGQNVYIDGPYGSINLDDSKHCSGIILIAGGAGIGPMLSLLRELADRAEDRPVRLIYGNGQLDQMVCLDELHELELLMSNFRLQLVCAEETDMAGIHKGVIDKTCIEHVLAPVEGQNWAVYLCGPAPMIKAVNRDLKKLNIPGDQIHYEQLAF